MLFLSRSKRRAKRIRIGYVVIDLTRDSILLPNGEIIPKENILGIDVQKKIIIYKGEDGKIHEIEYINKKE